MLTITRRIEWDMGHRLVDGYTSKCANLHGHRYTAEVTFGSDELDSVGMVMDFSDVTRICKGWIDQHVDHAVLVCVRDHALLAFCREQGDRHHVVAFNSTVERITPWLASQLQAEIDASPELFRRKVRIVRLRVNETPNGWAVWEAEATR